MSVTEVQCPQCHQSYNLTDDQLARYGGRRIKCAKCPGTIPVPAPVGIGSPVDTDVPPPPFEVGPATIPPPFAPPPPAGAAQSRASSRPVDAGTLAFEGSQTPSLALLPGETVRDVFDARAADLGFLGRLLGHRKRLVLTTHRLIRFEKRVLTNSLEIVWLPRVTGATVGQGVSSAFLVGVGAVISGLLAALGGLGALLGGHSGDTGSGVATLIVGLLIALVGVMIILGSRTKVMTVQTAGGQSYGLTLLRVDSQESKRFADVVFDVLHRTQEPG